jgi:hypothetical protein
MMCSSCHGPMFIILGDRAFCERCYQSLLTQQRQLVRDFPYRKVGTEEGGKDA